MSLLVAICPKAMVYERQDILTPLELRHSGEPTIRNLSISTHSKSNEANPVFVVPPLTSAVKALADLFEPLTGKRPYGGQDTTQIPEFRVKPSPIECANSSLRLCQYDLNSRFILQSRFVLHGLNLVLYAMRKANSEYIDVSMLAITVITVDHKVRDGEEAI